MTIGTEYALLLVDVQNDFCPGGALPVPNGDRVVEPLSRAAEAFAAAGLPVLASRDWHPAETSHFSAFGGIWPVHCVQDTEGAAFHPGLVLPRQTIIISKGMAADADCYSAFDGCDGEGRTLAELLTSLGVRHLAVGGLATDYCVRASVLDALRCGMAVTLLIDGCAGVEVHAGDTRRAEEDMIVAGADLRTVAEVTGR